MFLKTLRLSCLVLVCVAIFGCAFGKQADLRVMLQSHVVYQCEHEALIAARYYSLTDDSLHFVKLTLPDGAQFTLPNVLSASGARYTDDVELIWWSKGDNAFAQHRDQNGQWQDLYLECRVIDVQSK